MVFYLTAFIIAIACSTITIKTLVGYTDLRFIYKIFIGAIVVSGWFGFLFLHLIKSQNIFTVEAYAVLAKVLYTLMGFVFILFIFLMLRDIIWYLLFYLLKLVRIDAWYLDPQNLSVLNKANLLVVFLAMLACGYGMYEGHKSPNIIEEKIYSNKVSRNLRIAHVSDLHITRATSQSQLLRVINDVNMTNPDIIVLTGDIIDDNIPMIQEKINLLSGLSAPYGVFAVMGNHEFYNDVYMAKRTLESIGIKFLFNGGVHVANSNIYIAGLPDFGTMFERINLWRSVRDAKKDDYRVLLSHQPIIADSINKELYDLILSGHTHGGQVFPMHFFAQKANTYLAGRYKVNGIDLIVSRGAGTWGPSMRLFAPSDIIVIDLLKK